VLNLLSKLLVASIVFLKLQGYTFNGKVIVDSNTLFIFLMLHKCFIIGMNLVEQCKIYHYKYVCLFFECISGIVMQCML
jgi:hypothetical protein